LSIFGNFMFSLDLLIYFSQDCYFLGNVGNVWISAVRSLYQKKIRKIMQKQSNAFKKKHSGHKELYVKHNSSVNQPYTYMWSWVAYIVQRMFASTTSWVSSFFYPPQKLEIDFLNSHIHKPVEVGGSPAYAFACAHALQFSKWFWHHLQKACDTRSLLWHPKNLWNLVAQGDVHPTHVTRCLWCGTSMVPPHKPRKKCPDIFELENVAFAREPCILPKHRPPRGGVRGSEPISRKTPPGSNTTKFWGNIAIL